MVHAATLRLPRDFVDRWQEIQALRRDLGVGDDVLLDPAHFLASTDSHRQSCSVACLREEELIGIFYATEHIAAGIHTGYAIGGDFIGRGLLLCAAEDETTVLRLSIETLLDNGIHSLHLRLLPRANFILNLPGIKQTRLEKVTPGDCLALTPTPSPTFEQFLRSLGKHTRRNVRNSMRKAESLGIEFVSSLSTEEYREAIKRLNVSSAFHANPMRIARDERLLAFHSASRRAGLRDRNGALISVVCGFTRQHRFHLLTQLNDSHLESLSLSVVLRGHLVRYLIDTGHTELQFMGGTSLTFGRFCQPLNYCSLYFDKKWGIASIAKRLANALVQFSAFVGSPIPEPLAMMCSGELERSKLIKRTAVGIGGYESEPG